MNLYLNVFYKKCIPAIFLLCTPVLYYSFGKYHVAALLPHPVKLFLYKRMECDVAAIEHSRLYDAERYIDAYFFGAALTISFLLLHGCNVIFAHQKVHTYFDYKRPVHRNARSALLASSAFFFGTFLSLSRWTRGDGCSWFVDVQNSKDFHEQFWTTLVVIGLSQATLLLLGAIIVMHFLRIIRH